MHRGFFTAKDVSGDQVSFLSFRLLHGYIPLAFACFFSEILGFLRFCFFSAKFRELIYSSVNQFEKD
jgi:hypothetical protein